MSEDDGAATEKEEPLWRFLRPDEFSAPVAPARESLRLGLTRVLKRFWPSNPRASNGDDPHGAPLAAAARERCRPPPMLEKRCAQLAAALDATGAQPIAVVIDPPHAGGLETLRELARARGYRQAQPPPRATLLKEPLAILAAVDALDGQPLLVPELDRLFLRTPESLSALRLLLDRLQERTAPTLLGCGSWAWRFLEEVIEIDTALPTRLVPGPLDAARLHRWFSIPGFRCAEGGGDVLVGDGPCGAQPPEYLRRLAAAARGSAGTARALWMEALRLPSPEEDRRPRTSGGPEDGRLRGDLLVVPWKQLTPPAFPGKAAGDDLMLVQLLLLHDGLEEAVARTMLPFEPARVGTRLRALAQAGLVRRDGGAWEVPPVAYPSVRRELASARFWTDGY